uniref:Uncharacterized protein n=1 Tax=Chrysotila carterae TaxID=13221 RepID=A0A7S4BPE4_CHRCT
MRLCMLDSHHFTFNAEDLLAANHSHGLSPSSSYTSRHKSTAIAASANFFSAHLSSYFHHSPASAVAAAADPGGPAVRGGSIPDMVVNSPSLLPLAVLISFLFAALPLQVFCLCFFSRRAHSNAKQIVRGGDIDATSATGSTSVTSPTTVPITAGAEHQVTQARRVMDPTGRWGARMKSPKKSKPEKKKRRGDARKREDGKLAAGEAQACTGLGQTCVRQ